MARYDPEGELAPRDRVARAMVRESDRTHAPVYLSMAHLPAAIVRERFPVVAELCRSAGFDLATDRIPVGPAAHYLIGGISTDLDGRTSLKGLFAAGEAARTGVHGANRLASNSLLEGLVFGARAGHAMRNWRDRRWWSTVTSPRAQPLPDGPALAFDLTEAALRERMWRDVGVFRDRAGLARVSEDFDRTWRSAVRSLAGGASLHANGWRLLFMLTVGRLVANAALRRTESRGTHWRTDFPERNDLDWKHSETDSFMNDMKEM
jgi:L-aspartate oxidase